MPSHPMFLPVLCALALPLAASCGDDDSDGGADASVDPDSGPPEPDAETDLATCPSADPSYPGALSNVSAGDDGDGVFVAGDLNGDPDRLTIVAYHQLGVETGTFELPYDLWGVDICRDFEPGAGCTGGNGLVPISGTLEITQVSGRITGQLTDAAFVDDRDDASCATEVAVTAFDEPL